MMPKSTATRRPCASTNRFPGCMSAWKKPSRSACVQEAAHHELGDALGIVTGGLQRLDDRARGCRRSIRWSARGPRCGSSRWRARGNRDRPWCAPRARTPPRLPCADRVRARRRPRASRPRRRAAGGAPPSRRARRCARRSAKRGKIAREFLLDAGTQHLHRDAARRIVRGLGFVDLRDGGRRDGLAEAMRTSPSSGLPRSRSTTASRCAGRERRQTVLQLARARCAMSSPTRSGRVASTWPSLICAGPRLSSARASRYARRQIACPSSARCPSTKRANFADAGIASRYSRGISASCRASVRAMCQSADT